MPMSASSGPVTQAYRARAHPGGSSVLVLEARDRVGGRVWTRPRPTARRSTSAAPGSDRARTPRTRSRWITTYPTWAKGDTVLIGNAGLKRYSGDVPPMNPISVASLGVAMTRLDNMAKQVPLEDPWNAARRRGIRRASARGSTPSTTWRRRRRAPCSAARSALDSILRSVVAARALPHPLGQRAQPPPLRRGRLPTRPLAAARSMRSRRGRARRSLIRDRRDQPGQGVTVGDGVECAPRVVASRLVSVTCLRPQLSSAARGAHAVGLDHQDLRRVRRAVLARRRFVRQSVRRALIEMTSTRRRNRHPACSPRCGPRPRTLARRRTRRSCDRCERSAEGAEPTTTRSRTGRRNAGREAATSRTCRPACSPSSAARCARRSVASTGPAPRPRPCRTAPSTARSAPAPSPNCSRARTQTAAVNRRPFLRYCRSCDYCRFEFVEENWVETVRPSTLTATMTMIAMNAIRRMYSTRFAPRSSRSPR